MFASPDVPLPPDLPARLKALALDAGFDVAGIARAAPTRYDQQYRDWIAAGKHGEMHYLEKNIDERLDVTRKFPWARSVLCVALAYFQPPPAHADPAFAPPDSAKIAKYAWGRDYHKVIEAKLKTVEQQLRALLAPHDFHARAYTDTGPILERELAQRAGLGWVGKHTLLLHPRHGSYFLLGELVLSLDLAPDSPITDHCGTCTRCIDACPTAAISPYSVDAVKCISYQTLENRGDIPSEFHAPMQAANFLVGCDICQDVCPFNRRPLPTSEPDFTASPVPALSATDVLEWSGQDWDCATRGRAFRRTKHDMLQRNAAILTGISITRVAPPTPLTPPDASAGSSTEPPHSAPAPA